MQASTTVHRQLSPMTLVHITSRELMKPTRRQPSPNAAVPLTIFDKAFPSCFQLPMVYVGRPPMPPLPTLKQGLAETLNYFPHLAGRLATINGHRSIVLNDAGIRVAWARVDADLEELIPDACPSPKMTILYPPINDVEELLLIQFNQFKCGGMAILLAVHHQVGDGQCTSSFLVAWSQLVRGLAVNPMPYHDRAAIAAHRLHPKVEFNHKDIEFSKQHIKYLANPVENIVVHYSVDIIKYLKSIVARSNPEGKRPATTFECVLGDVWKKVTVARKLKGEETTHVRISVSGRQRIQPNVPKEYFGCFVLWAHPKLKARDLVAGSLATVTKEIKDSVSQIDNRYFQSFKDFGAEAMPEEELVVAISAAPPGISGSMSPNLEMTSWLKLEFEKIDFGSGGPLAFFPAYLAIEGQMVFLASSKEKGAVDVVIALHKDTLLLFRQIEDHYMKMEPAMSKL